MFHVAGTSNVFACTWVGARQTILPRFEARSVLATIERDRISHTVFVPTMLAMLLEHAEGADMSSVRHLQYAASPIAPDLQRRVLEWLPECDVVQFYGMTEAAPTITQLSAGDHRRGHRGEQPYASRLRSIGVPVVGVQAEIRDLDGGRVGAGEIGELCVRGPNVMLGYWNRPDETAQALRGGWMHTGDAGYMDDGGYVFLTDRIKDMIISGGENVYSVEVENVLAQHPAVATVAVIGVPDETWGERVHAVVVPAAGRTVTLEELRTFCAERVAGYKAPRSVELVGTLPLSAAGKVLKRQLREPFWEGQDRAVH
jgi:acyl-CoA synthetase (AMP-forming)/AMP-acid ligase II